MGVWSGVEALGGGGGRRRWVLLQVILLALRLEVSCLSLRLGERPLTRTILVWGTGLRAQDAQGYSGVLSTPAALPPAACCCRRLCWRVAARAAAGGSRPAAASGSKSKQPCCLGWCCPPAHAAAWRSIPPVVRRSASPAPHSCSRVPSSTRATPGRASTAGSPWSCRQAMLYCLYVYTLLVHSAICFVVALVVVV